MTAHASAADRQLGLDAGMNDFISKPFDAAAALDVVAAWIGTSVATGDQEVA